jgi:hypothetical protein
MTKNKIDKNFRDAYSRRQKPCVNDNGFYAFVIILLIMVSVLLVLL